MLKRHGVVFVGGLFCPIRDGEGALSRGNEVEGIKDLYPVGSLGGRVYVAGALLEQGVGTVYHKGEALLNALCEQ